MAVQEMTAQPQEATMSPRIKLALVGAVGFAMGIAAAQLDRRPPAMTAPVRVDVRGGSIDGKMSHELRPVSIRVGDDIRRLGDPVQGTTVMKTATTCTVNLSVNGQPVRTEFEVMP